MKRFIRLLTLLSIISGVQHLYAQRLPYPFKVPSSEWVNLFITPDTGQVSNVFDRILHEQPTHVVYWLWDERLKDWKQNHQEWYVYNPAEQVFTVLDQSWNGTNWVDESRIT